MASKRDELLTVAQLLAELGNVSQRTFYRWREIGELAGVPGKRGILRRMVTAALDDPDGTVREVVYPAVPGREKMLRDLARELMATERVVAERVRYQLRGS